MKVLFGMCEQSIVDKIVKYYEKKYKEKIEYLAIEYIELFKAILSNTKYDRIVIDEEGRKSTSFISEEYKYYKFLFDNLKNILEYIDSKNIIYLVSDDRIMGRDKLISRLYVNEIYSVLAGKDKNIKNICKCLNKPLSRNDVNEYFLIPNTKKEDKDCVVKDRGIELEKLININKEFENFGNNTQKYNDYFNELALKHSLRRIGIIIDWIPSHVKKYLEENNILYKFILKENKPTIRTIICPYCGCTDAKMILHFEKQEINPKDGKTYRVPGGYIYECNECERRFEV